MVVVGMVWIFSSLSPTTFNSPEVSSGVVTSALAAAAPALSWNPHFSQKRMDLDFSTFSFRRVPHFGQNFIFFSSTHTFVFSNKRET